MENGGNKILASLHLILDRNYRFAHAIGKYSIYRKKFNMIGATTYSSLLILTCLAVLAIYSPPTMACSCMLSHPQATYCNADYVILARIMGKTAVGNLAAYDVKIEKSYKMTPEGEKTLKHCRLLTPLKKSLCIVNLTLGKLYIIAGRGPNLNLCNYIKEYSELSLIERTGFSKVYRKACGCEVKTCLHENCLAETDAATGCNWLPFDKCEDDLNVCMPEGPAGHCQWQKMPPYVECHKIISSASNMSLN